MSGSGRVAGSSGRGRGGRGVGVVGREGASCVCVVVFLFCFGGEILEERKGEGGREMLVGVLTVDGLLVSSRWLGLRRHCLAVEEEAGERCRWVVIRGRCVWEGVGARS